MVKPFPAKKNAGCPKASRDFPPRKDGILGILHSRSGCLGTSLPLPQSLYGRTLTSQPKFFRIDRLPNFLSDGAPLAGFARRLRNNEHNWGSDISDKPAFTPPGHIKRQHCKSKEALFCNIFDFFLIVCTLDFQAGNFTCIHRMRSFEDISCKRLLLQGKDPKNARRRLWKKLERFNRAQKSLF